MHSLTSAPGFSLIILRSEDLEDFSNHDDDDDEEDMDDNLVTNSPVPPEFVEPDDSMQTDENGQPGRLHPEQDLPHLFKVCVSQLVCSLCKSLTCTKLIVTPADEDFPFFLFL